MEMWLSGVGVFQFCLILGAESTRSLIKYESVITDTVKFHICPNGACHHQSDSRTVFINIFDHVIGYIETRSYV